MSQRLAAELLAKYKFTTDIIQDNEKLAHLPLAPPTDLSLYLYGRAKQFEIGDCNTEQPSIWHITALFKWRAWSSVQGTPKLQALFEYLVALRDYILGLEINFSAEGCQLKQGMLEACTLTDEHIKFIHSGGTYIPPMEKGDAASTDTGITYTLDTELTTTASSIVAQLPSPIISTNCLPAPSSSFSTTTTSSPTITISPTVVTPSATTTTLSAPHSTTSCPPPHSSPLSTSLPTMQSDGGDEEMIEQQIPQQHLHFAETPKKLDKISSCSNNVIKPEIHFSPQSIRVGSRAARKSAHNHYHQTPTKSLPVLNSSNPYYAFSTHQTLPQHGFIEPSLDTGTDGGGLSTPNIAPTPSSTLNLLTTKETFLELQQHATHTQNKQLLLLLSLIDQRETSNFLKFQAYKQQQQQHLEFIDQLQQQISSNYHSQEILIKNFNALSRDYTVLKQQHEQIAKQVSPISKGLIEQRQLLDQTANNTQSWIQKLEKLGAKVSYCSSLLEQKFPMGWRGIRKRIIYWIKWILRFYTMYATVLALDDIRNWCLKSRWIYKNITLPFQQYINRK